MCVWRGFLKSEANLQNNPHCTMRTGFLMLILEVSLPLTHCGSFGGYGIALELQGWWPH